MPYAPGDPEGPKGPDPEAMKRSLTEPGWQRWFVAETADGKIIGHVDFKASRLKTELHRCELGIGIEGPFRGRGLGRRLMETAIAFARQSDTLAWIDLMVFANNVPARALYRKLGFVEVGSVADRFRIEGESIDDVTMVLRVAE